jgi:fructosamine-3-kinase
MASWVEFFAERRLVHLANEAHRAGMLDRDMRTRVERFARDRLALLIREPAHPSLLHGDAWGGNILVRGGRVAAFIDPAVYHGHAEAELAFGTLFGTFTEHFFGAYRERRMIAEGFFDVRRDVYNLYPLLVHARLFGGGYVAQIDATLRRFGG